jgi:hypothetical protein
VGGTFAFAISIKASLAMMAVPFGACCVTPIQDSLMPVWISERLFRKPGKENIDVSPIHSAQWVAGVAIKKTKARKVALSAPLLRLCRLADYGSTY